jgi:hypothetical protein
MNTDPQVPGSISDYIRSYRFHTEGFNLKKLNGVEGKEKYCACVSNTFAVLEDLDCEVEINNTKIQPERI